MIYIMNTSLDPAYNLAFEEYVFNNFREDEILIVWRNSPAMVCGRYQNIFSEADIDLCRERGVALLRRGSGGGTVYHDAGNINYTIIKDAQGIGADYASFLNPIVKALRSFGVPAEIKRTSSIDADGFKISGSSQKREGGRVLHHGTILFTADLKAMHALTASKNGKYTSKAISSSPYPVANIQPAYGIPFGEEEFILAFKGRVLPPESKTVLLTKEQEKEVNLLADQKYRSDDWTFGCNPAFRFENLFNYDGEKVSLDYNSKNGIITEIRIETDAFNESRAEGALIGAKLWHKLDKACAEAGCPGLEKYIL